MDVYFVLCFHWRCQPTRRLVIAQLHVRSLYIPKKVRLGTIQHNAWQGARSPCQLFLTRSDVFFVNMRIANLEEDAPCFEVCLMRDEVQQQSCGRNVKRQAQKDVGGTLIHLDA